MSVDLTKIDPSRVRFGKGKSVDLTQIHPDRISTDPKSNDVMGESLSAGVSAAKDTEPKLGLMPTWDRAHGVGRAMVGNLQKQMVQDFKVPDVFEVINAGLKQSQGTADPSNAPTAQQLVDQQPLGRLMQKEGFKDSFASTPLTLPVRGLLAPFVGGEKAKNAIKEAPNAAANMIESGVSDPVSYIPGAVFEKPLLVGGKTLGKIPGVAKAGSWLAEQTTGVSRKLWEHYAKHADEINQLAKNYVGENRYFQAFKDARNSWAGAVEARKADLGQLIEQGLKEAPRASKISTKTILDELNNAKKTLHPEYDAPVLAEIDGMINKIRSVAPEGKMSAWDLYHTQRFLHDRAGRAFSEGGQIFNNSPKAARAAKAARYKATELVNQHFPDTIAKANKEYVELHNIDDILPKSILDAEGSTAALRKAALDPNSKEAEALKRLGKFLYGDESRLLHEAKNAATFESMTNLPLNPRSGGGTTSTSRTILGGGIGLGSQFSDDPKVKALGGAAGAAIASPAVLKMMLDAGLEVPRRAKALAGKGGLLEKGANKISPAIKALDAKGGLLFNKGAEAASPYVQGLNRIMAPHIEKAGEIAKDFLKDETGAFTPEQLLGLIKRDDGPNVYDLIKARKEAGPAKGLLPGEGGNPAGAFPDLNNPGASSYPVSESDMAIVQQLIDKSTQGIPFTEKEADWLRDFRKWKVRSQDKHLTNLTNNLQGWNSTQEANLIERRGYQPTDQSLWKLTSEQLGRKILELPNLDKETTRRVGAAWDTIDNLRKNQSLSMEQRSDAINHVHQNLMALYEDLSARQPRGLLTNLNVERGPVKELPEAGDVIANVRPTNSGMRVDKVAKPASLDELERAVSSGEPLSRNEVSELFALSQKGGPTSERAHAILDKHDQILSQLAKDQDIARAETQARKQKAAAEKQKAAAEREAKKVVSVDVPGAPKRGRAPSIKPEMAYKPRVVPTDLKPQAPVEVPLGGSVTLKKAQTNSAYNSNPKFKVIEALDDDSGYLVHDPDTGRPFEVLHEDISGVFDKKGKSVKPKGKPTKPKGKK